MTTLSPRAGAPDRARPLLTVAIPAFNRVALLEQCLESVLSQLGPGVEVVVSDDSTDESPGVLARRLLAGCRSATTYVRNVPSRGMAGNWNSCIRLASGRHVLLLHDDDYLYPGAISRIVRQCERSDWAVGQFAVKVVGDRRPLARPRRHRSGYLSPARAVRRLLSNSSFVRFPGMVVARSSYEETGLFDESIGPAADLDMWIRLFSRYGLWRFDGLVAAYRVHAGALTGGMWTPEVVSSIDSLFSRVRALGTIPDADLDRHRSSWFHQFVLAGAVRELRHRRPDRAREVVRLLDLPELRELRQPSPAWRFGRAGLSLALRTTRSSVSARTPG